MAKQQQQKRVPIEVSIHWRYLHQDMKKSSKEIQADRARGYHLYSKATICRHMKKSVSDAVVDRRKFNKGRPAKLTDRDRRSILRQIDVLRSRNEMNFSVKKIKVMAGLSRDVCDESVRLVLKRNGFAFRNAARKGVLKKEDLAKRLEFAKTIQRKFADSGANLWQKGIAFYLDGASFTHKYNPLDQAQAPRKKIWRQKKERLSFGMTAKSSNTGVGGRRAHFMVGIGYSKGVIFCEQYEGRLNGQKFAEFVRTKLPDAFANSVNPTGKYFLQDGDPSQNSKKAEDAFISIGARKFAIPPRSPDLNPIENVFHTVKNQLREDALELQIEEENWEQFCARVKQTIESTDKDYIDKTIASLGTRIDLVIKHKGERLKY
jgi:transposase